jgi:hypothetical protein
MPPVCSVCKGDDGCVDAAVHFQILYDTHPAGGPFRDRWGHGRRIYIKVSASDVRLPFALEAVREDYPQGKFQMFPATYDRGRFLTAMLVIVELP